MEPEASVARPGILSSAMVGSRLVLDHFGRSCDSILPQLKSLTLIIPTTYSPSSLMVSVGPHIKELRSLKCVWSAVDKLPELLEVCLLSLDIDLEYSRCKVQISSDSQAAATLKIVLKTGEANDISLPKLSPVPPNLQRLTIRVPVFVETTHSTGNPPTSRCCSYLPAAALLINSFGSSVQHLILAIDFLLCGILSNLAKVDFSPLAVLGAASLSILRIDLCAHTAILPPRHPRSSIVVAGGVRRCKEVD